MVDRALVELVHLEMTDLLPLGASGMCGILEYSETQSQENKQSDPWERRPSFRREYGDIQQVRQSVAYGRVE